MEVKINLTYEQLLEIIKQFPADEVKKLVKDAEILLQKKKVEGKPFTLDDEFLMSAPVMTDEQYEEFLEHRKQFAVCKKK